MSSYTLVHRRLAPLLEAARAFDIATNPHLAALFEAGSAELQIWCTPEDHPGGLWNQVQMDAGAFFKPCEYLASAHWQWSEGEQPTVIGIRLSTDAYALQDARLLKGRQIHNRPEDLLGRGEAGLALAGLQGRRADASGGGGRGVGSCRWGCGGRQTAPGSPPGFAPWAPSPSQPALGGLGGGQRAAGSPLWPCGSQMGTRPRTLPGGGS